MDYIELGLIYGVMESMLREMSKPNRERWYDRLGDLQEKNLLPEFDWTEISENSD